MLELLMKFFDHTSVPVPENNVPPHLRLDEFDTADSFICSLNLNEEEKPTSLLH